MSFIRYKFPYSDGNSKKLKNAAWGPTIIKLLLMFIFITGSLITTATVVSAAPGAPELSQPSTGNFWVLHSWTAGTGEDATDSYRIFYDNSWHYDITETSFNHAELGPHGTSTIIIVAYNTSTDTTSSEVTSTVQIPNNHISITSVSSQVSIPLGETVSVNADYTDLDADIPVFSCSDTDKFSNFDTATGEGTWTPDSAGAYSVDFGVSDEYDSSDSITMEITVTRTDSPPVLNPIGNQEVDEGKTLRIIISATDPDDNDKDITYSATNLPSGATFSQKYSYFNWVPGPGTEGYYDVEFVATSNGLTDRETITIEVIGPDDAPVLARIGEKSAIVNHPLTFTISATDVDNDDGGITYSATGLPSGASINRDTGKFSWTPKSTGTYNVVFTATSNGLKDTEEVKIVVVADKPPELIAIGDQRGNENERLTFIISATDADNDDGDITYYATGLPSGASINSNTGVFSWTPDYAAEGTYEVEFVASSLGLTDSETITITIDNTDRPPVLTSIGNKPVDENELLSFNISASDPDEDATITYSAKNLPDGATFNPTTATFSWTPGYNDSGDYEVEFVANSNGLIDSETITITVGDYNRPPELSSIGSKNIEEEKELRITLSATDPDSNNVTYSSQNLPGNSTFNESTAVFSWTPEKGDAGTYYVLFSVSDGMVNDSENVTITVTVPKTSSSSSSGGGGGSSSSSSGGGGGGGGGAAVSSEEYENIVSKDYVLKPSVLRDVDTIFTFEKPEHSITSVSFIPKVNAGQSKAVVEILKDTSSQVSSSAPGNVYKNINIYLDTSLVPTAIDDIEIAFEVEKSWINRNKINISHIALCRYTSGEWELLSTEMTDEDSEYMYFTSESKGFSSFAISSIDPASLVELIPKSTVSIPQSDEGILGSTVDSLELDSEASQKSVSAFGFVVILILAGIGIIYWSVKME